MSQLTKYTINNKACYGLKSRTFTVKGKQYEVISSKSTGRGHHDVTHTIMNTETKEVYEMPMEKLIKALQAEETTKQRSINAVS